MSICVRSRSQTIVYISALKYTLHNFHLYIYSYFIILRKKIHSIIWISRHCHFLCIKGNKTLPPVNNS